MADAAGKSDSYSFVQCFCYPYGLCFHRKAVREERNIEVRFVLDFVFFINVLIKTTITIYCLILREIYVGI